ncbi:MAG: homoserine O-acetyltransferase [Coriobacteriia bacterium]|nr:homoserine O-acetyltransferase [Coriobacteriia bacterium]
MSAVNAAPPAFTAVAHAAGTLRLAEPLTLLGGRVLPGAEVAYETFGTLSPDGGNAVLICHALSGDAHVSAVPGAADPRFARAGWWDAMVGPGKGIDTDRYFVVCSNVLGGCSGTTGPASPDPETGHPYGLRFPLVTVEDMVDVQARLLDALGVRRLLAVIGGSMGGMQALAWAKRYPERVGSVIADATTWRLSAQAIAFNEVGRSAILEDPAFAGGDYYGRGRQPDPGLAIARMVGHITYLSDESMREKFGRRLRERSEYAFGFVHEFEVETYLAYQGKRFVERFDANTYLYMTKAMDYFDWCGESPTLAEALRPVTARFLVLSFSSDWLFPTYQAREIVGALLANGAEVSFAEVPSPYGHDAFLLEEEAQTGLIGPFLHVGREQGLGLVPAATAEGGAR